MDRWSVLVKPLEQTGPGKHSVPCAFGADQLVLACANFLWQRDMSQARWTRRSFGAAREGSAVALGGSSASRDPDQVPRCGRTGTRGMGTGRMEQRLPRTPGPAT